MNLREQFEKETGMTLPNLNGMPSVKSYIQRLEQRNKEQVGVLKECHSIFESEVNQWGARRKQHWHYPMLTEIEEQLKKSGEL